MAASDGPCTTMDSLDQLKHVARFLRWSPATHPSIPKTRTNNSINRTNHTTRPIHSRLMNSKITARNTIITLVTTITKQEAMHPLFLDSITRNRFPLNLRISFPNYRQ
jgi:hypothetical protein